MAQSKPTIYYGSVINPISLTSYDALSNTLIAVNVQGNIDWIVHDIIDSLIQETLLKQGYGGIDDVEFVVLSKGQFIMPGLVDTHTVSDVSIFCIEHLCWDIETIACTSGTECRDVCYSDSDSSCWTWPWTHSRGYQYELLDWLDKFTFPMESKFKNVEFARKVYPSVVERFIAFGVGTFWSLLSGLC